MKEETNPIWIMLTLLFDAYQLFGALDSSNLTPEENKLVENWMDQYSEKVVPAESRVGLIAEAFAEEEE